MSRYFFVAVGAFCILLAFAGFGPNVYQYFTGRLFYPPLVHVHALIMLTWLILYTLQAGLAARGNLRQHRRLGWFTVGWAGLVWVSSAIGPIEAMLRYDPDKFGFIVKPFLISIGTVVVFPVFVICAIRARRHTDWHKRLMTFATFSLIQAALDRMHWLPDEGLPMFWHAGLRLYVLLILPLVVFDFATLRRIHPATLIAFMIVVAMHAVVSFYWNDAGWNQVARGFWLWLRAVG